MDCIVGLFQQKFGKFLLWLLVQVVAQVVGIVLMLMVLVEEVEEDFHMELFLYIQEKLYLFELVLVELAEFPPVMQELLMVWVVEIVI
jgi:hypothetical protein